MNNVNRITQLSEKKPLQALIYALGIAILTLSGVVGKLYFELKDKNAEMKSALAAKDTVIAFNAAQFGKVIVVKDNQIASLNDRIIQRTDDDLKRMRQDYEARIAETREIDRTRDRNRAVKRELMKVNTDKLNTIENLTNEN